MESGSYEILRTIGQGAVARVALARAQDGTLVAHKALLPEFCEDADARRRFLLGGELLARVKHPNVVRLVEVLYEEPALVLELATGGDLDEVLRRKGPLEPALAVAVVATVAEGLAAVHEAGAVHRDVKPANILIRDDGGLLLADFGLGLDQRAEVSWTRPGALVGTPEFMSPEQCDGLEVDARADLYGLGATLYALVAGRPPFSGHTLDVLCAHVRERPATIVGLPVSIEGALRELLARRPADRPPSAAEAAAKLRALLRKAGTGVDPRERLLELLALASTAGEEEAGENVPREKSQIGPYEVIRELGRGGMGVVFEAYDPILRRAVAIKQLRSGLSEVERVRFAREARLCARLRHPGIAAVHEVAEESDGTAYLVMEFVRGRPLAQALSAGPWTGRRAAAVVRALAEAVDHAHAQGVVHRDLKPQNVVLRETTGEPVLLDFGIGCLLEGETAPLTRSGQLLGTVSYVAPEQAKGASKAGTPADVYGLGAVLYECVAGRPAFVGASELEILDAVLRRDPEPPSRWRPTVVANLDTICLKCLEKEPGRRYESAGAVARDLAAFLRGDAISARPLGVFARMARSAQRQRFLLLAVACAGLLGAGLALLPALREHMAARTRAQQRERAAEAFEQTLAESEGLLSRPGSAEERLGWTRKAVGILDPLALRERLFASTAPDAIGQDDVAAVVSGVLVRRAAALRTGRGRACLRVAAVEREVGNDQGWLLSTLAAYRAEPRGQSGWEALYGLGEHLLEEAQYERAKAAFGRLVPQAADEAQEARAQFRLADSLLNLDRPEAARHLYRRALAHLPSDLQGEARRRRRLAGFLGDRRRLSAQPVDGAICDLDGDGVSEVVLLERTQLTLLDRKGRGRRARIPFDAKRHGEWLTLLELDGRPGKELLVTTSGRWSGDAPLLVAYRWQGDRFMALWSRPFPPGSSSSRAFAGDVDGDGLDEVFVAYFLGRESAVLRLQAGLAGPGEAHQVYPAPGEAGSVPVAIQLADLTGDGRPELLLGLGPWGHYEVRVYEVPTSGSERLLFKRRMGVIRDLLAEDLDGDARPEAFVVNLIDSSSDLPAVFGPRLEQQAPSGVYALSVRESEFVLEPLWTVACEAKNDGGIVSVRTVQRGAHPLLAFEFQQPGEDGRVRSWALFGWLRGAELIMDKVYLGPGPQRVLAAADLDGDGDPELLIARDGSVELTGVKPRGSPGDEELFPGSVAVEEPPEIGSYEASAELRVGDDLLALGFFGAARSAYEKASTLAAAPRERGLAHLGLTRLLRRAGSPLEACAEAAKAVQIAPGLSARTARIRARALEDAWRFSESLGAWQAVLDHPLLNWEARHGAEEERRRLLALTDLRRTYELSGFSDLPALFRVDGADRMRIQEDGSLLFGLDRSRGQRLWAPWFQDQGPVLLKIEARVLAIAWNTALTISLRSTADSEVSLSMGHSVWGGGAPAAHHRTFSLTERARRASRSGVANLVGFEHGWVRLRLLYLPERRRLRADVTRCRDGARLATLELPLAERLPRGTYVLEVGDAARRPWTGDRGALELRNLALWTAETNGSEAGDARGQTSVSANGLRPGDALHANARSERWALLGEAAPRANPHAPGTDPRAHRAEPIAPRIAWLTALAAFRSGHEQEAAGLLDQLAAKGSGERLRQLAGPAVHVLTTSERAAVVAALARVSSLSCAHPKLSAAGMDSAAGHAPLAEGEEDSGSALLEVECSLVHRPREREALLRQAKLLSRLGRHQEALSKLDSLTEIEPQWEAAHEANVAARHARDWYFAEQSAAASSAAEAHPGGQARDRRTVR